MMNKTLQRPEHWKREESIKTDGESQTKGPGKAVKADRADSTTQTGTDLQSGT